MSDIRGPQDKAGNWDIVGTAGNDNLYGGKGDNHFDGGAGEDTVFHGGYADQVEVRFDAASQSYKIGNDTLKNVEYIQFSDARMTVEEAARMERPQYHVVEAADGSKQVQASGTNTANRLTGGDGNDTLTGNGGDDGLHGGKGEDTAAFSGDRADYDIRFDYNTNLYVVTDNRAGRDGKDTMWQIEQLKFADTTIKLHAINGISGPPDAATVAKLDGVIEAPPPPPAGDYGDLIGIIDTWVPIELVHVTTLPVDLFTIGELGTTTTVTTTSAAFIMGSASADQVTLAGVPSFAAASTAGYLLDAP